MSWLTKAELAVLRSAADVDRIYPRYSRKRAADNLEGRGLLRVSHAGVSVGYSITAAGREALAQGGGEAK